MRRKHFSAAEARRIALAALGFGKPRPSGRIDARHISGVIRRLGLLQLDFVNVLVPAHELIVYSRLGPYPRTTFDRAVYGQGEFTEHWAHEASIVPVASWPLLRYRRAQFRPSQGSPLFSIRNHRKYLADIIEKIRENGPLSAQDLEPVAGPKRRPGDWHRSIPRRALDHHFGHGRLAVCGRLPNFQRVYDLPERVIPPQHFDLEYSDADGRKALVGKAARALGIATTKDIADYFRMTAREALPALESLAAEGSVHHAEVEGWKQPAWLAADARLPRTLDATALLSPFDPVVWYRPRSERLFDFHYRIEIYVPERQRKWGYYVLPFLCGDRIAARVDLKAERRARQLQVRAAHIEDGSDAELCAARLAGELRMLADWLELESITVGRRGAFAPALAHAVREAR